MECKYSVEVLHVKSLSLLVKDNVLYFLHFIFMYYGLWVRDAIERGIKGVHSEFHYELLDIKKGRG